MTLGHPVSQRGEGGTMEIRRFISSCCFCFCFCLSLPVDLFLLISCFCLSFVLSLVVAFVFVFVCCETTPGYEKEVSLQSNLQSEI